MWHILSILCLHVIGFKSFNISLNFLDSEKSVKIDYSSLPLFKIGPVSLYSLKLVYQNTPSNNNFDDSQVGPIYGYGQNALRSSLLLSGIKGSMRIFSVSLSLDHRQKCRQGRHWGYTGMLPLRPPRSILLVQLMSKYIYVIDKSLFSFFYTSLIFW